MKSIYALIFDFDGLIIDSESPAFEAWKTIYAEYQQELPLEKWVLCVGSSAESFNPISYLESLTAQNLKNAGLLEKKNQIKAAICDELSLLNGVEAKIIEAQNLGWKIAVASSSSNKWVCHHLKRLKIYKHFDCVITKDDVKNVKPDPEMYIKTASTLQVRAQNCVVCEDSLNGVKAANAAQMISYAIPNNITKNLNFDCANKLYSSLDEFKLAEVFT